MALWKFGVTLAVLGLAGCGVVAVAVLTAKPENGANIGAAFIGSAAVALSVVAESFLIASTDRSSWKAVGTAGISAWLLWLGIFATGLLRRVDLLIVLVPIGLRLASLVLLYRGSKDQAVHGRGATSP